MPASLRRFCLAARFPHKAPSFSAATTFVAACLLVGALAAAPVARAQAGSAEKPADSLASALDSSSPPPSGDTTAGGARPYQPYATSFYGRQRLRVGTASRSGHMISGRPPRSGCVFGEKKSRIFVRVTA
jgi:hypothetical protein